MMVSNNLQNVVHNPMIPYVGTLSEELGPGKLVIIHGCVPSDADRFQVDFQCGNSVKPRADVAFHFNPRFKRSGHIVCNTLTREKWGREEITYDMPFEKGKDFKIMFMVLKDKFQVAVNGKHLLLYEHRIKPDKIDTLGIYGKVWIEKIEFPNNMSLEGNQATSLGTVNMNSSNVGLELALAQMLSHLKSTISQKRFNKFKQLEMVRDCLCAQDEGLAAFSIFILHEHRYDSDLLVQTSGVSQFTLPYIARLKSPVKAGQTIVIKGEVKKNPKGSFSIDFIAASTKDIALHLNPRLNAKVFVRNSFLCESWGEEERSITYFPFCPGMYFEMIIYCSTSEYKIAINGVHAFIYKHRFKELDRIDTLKIDGDINLLDIRSW